jgi:hypothetical protein
MFKMSVLFEIQYNYDKMQNRFHKNELTTSRVKDPWHRKALPVGDQFKVTLGEGFTPIIETRLAHGFKMIVKLDITAFFMLDLICLRIQLTSEFTCQSQVLTFRRN